MARLTPFLLAGLLLPLTACLNLEYDLSPISVPISAKPADSGVVTEPFTLTAKNILWAHGLFGQSSPDVAALLRTEAQGSSGIVGFRVEQRSGFHEWLVAHLTLTLVRMRTVVIEGERRIP